jgi:hypothetical protein
MDGLLPRADETTWSKHKPRKRDGRINHAYFGGVLREGCSQPLWPSLHVHLNQQRPDRSTTHAEGGRGYTPEGAGLCWMRGRHPLPTTSKARDLQTTSLQEGLAKQFLQRYGHRSRHRRARRGRFAACPPLRPRCTSLASRAAACTRPSLHHNAVSDFKVHASDGRQLVSPLRRLLHKAAMLLSAPNCSFVAQPFASLPHGPIHSPLHFLTATFTVRPHVRTATFTVRPHVHSGVNANCEREFAFGNC